MPKTFDAPKKITRKFIVNQDFLDEDSEKTWYFWGALFRCYTPTKPNGMKIGSKYKELAEKFRKELAPKHALSSYKTRKNISSYWIELDSVPYLRARLEELDLDKPKEERRFPKGIEKEKLSHIVRGVFDATSGIRISQNRYTRVRMGINPDFNLGLNKELSKYDIRGRLYEKSIFFTHNESVKLHDFMYQNFRLIRKQGIYLPFKKELFNLDYVADSSADIAYLKSKKRIERAKRLLDKGKKIKDVAKKVGYFHCVSFSRAFKKITGQTPSEYKNLVKRKD